MSNDDKSKFLKQVKSSVRQYAFISEFITYVDAELGKFYLNNFTVMMYEWYRNE